jgi:hypothetical protein
MESLGDRTTGKRIKQLCPEMKLAIANRLAKAHYGSLKLNFSTNLDALCIGISYLLIDSNTAMTKLVF